METRSLAPAGRPAPVDRTAGRPAPQRGAGAEAGHAPAIRLTGLTKRFGAVQAVDGIDLMVQPGEVVAFLGPNGAGKTTTIDMLLGLAEPTTGVVQVCGVSPREAIEAGWVSAVMQTGGLLKDLTVAETVSLTASLFGRGVDVAAVLARAGIADIAGRRVAKCSGGQQQRLRFAMALVPEPRLLLLDEPTTGMDIEGRRSFWSAIREDAAAGRTVVFATHYLEEADAYADRIVLVAGGRVVADGTAAQVKALSSGRSVRATWPGVTADDAAALRALPATEAVEVAGSTLTVHTRDSDALARHLLSATPARDLEITARALEDAFLALTAAPTGTPPPSSPSSASSPTARSTHREP